MLLPSDVATYVLGGPERIQMFQSLGAARASHRPVMAPGLEPQAQLTGW